MHHSGERMSRLLTVDGIRRHYDQFAWAYRSFWGEHIHHGLFANDKDKPRDAQNALLRLCADRAGVRRGYRVADVGCGYGGTARFLTREYACSVLGLTISPTQRTIAQKLSRFVGHPGSVEFELANAETYCFPAEHFDLVWNMESSEHFFDKPGYFMKVAATLRPGARLMVAAWTGSMKRELIRKIAEVFLCPELLTADQYFNCFTKAGLTPVSCLEIGQHVARTWDICAKRVGAAGPLIRVMPDQYKEFAEGIQLMRQGYRSGELSYSLLVAEKR